MEGLGQKAPCHQLKVVPVSVGPALVVSTRGVGPVRNQFRSSRFPRQWGSQRQLYFCPRTLSL